MTHIYIPLEFLNFLIYNKNITSNIFSRRTVFKKDWDSYGISDEKIRERFPEYADNIINEWEKKK